MSKKDFGCIRPFDIDNGELDDKTPQECFVLGYELALIDQLIERKKEIDRMVHADNCGRIEAALIKAGRQFAFVWPKDDVSEAWIQIGSPKP